MEPVEAAAADAAMLVPHALALAGAARAAAPALPVAEAPDDLIFFGDIPDTVDGVVETNYFAFILASWAFRYHVSRVAVTALLALLWGMLGRFLGIGTWLIKRRGPFPQTAKTVFDRAARVNDEVGLELFRKDTVPLTDPGIKGRWQRRHVEVCVPVDLRKCVALPLMNPDLNNPVTPAYYDHATPLPPGFVTACTWLGEKERAARAARLARVDLQAELTAQYPSIKPADVTVVAVGLNPFIDAAQAYEAQTAAVTGVLYRVTNTHPSVREQPKSIALGGTWIAPGVVSAAKVAGEDVSLRASSATLDRMHLVTNDIYMKVVVGPLRKALTGPALFIRAKHFRGLRGDVKARVRSVRRPPRTAPLSPRRLLRLAVRRSGLLPRPLQHGRPHDRRAPRAQAAPVPVRREQRGGPVQSEYGE